MRNAVFARDREAVFELMIDFGFIAAWRTDRVVVFESRSDTVVCPAVVIDASLFGTCSGRWTLDHVPDTMVEKMGMVIRGMARGKRAPSDPAHLISLCEGHCERGMKAGYQWNTSHRSEIRAYLEKVN